MEQLKTYVVDKSGRRWLVSTVELPSPDPLPYETAVFPVIDLYAISECGASCEQYETEAEALEGHQIMVDRVKAWEK